MIYLVAGKLQPGPAVKLAGVLSTRDIVRVWRRDGAACDVLAAP